jgi:hypothetical protein
MEAFAISRRFGLLSSPYPRPDSIISAAGGGTPSSVAWRGCDLTLPAGRGGCPASSRWRDSGSFSTAGRYFRNAADHVPFPTGRLQAPPPFPSHEDAVGTETSPSACSRKDRSPPAACPRIASNGRCRPVGRGLRPRPPSNHAGPAGSADPPRRSVGTSRGGDGDPALRLHRKGPLVPERAAPAVPPPGQTASSCIYEPGAVTHTNRGRNLQFAITPPGTPVEDAPPSPANLRAARGE